MHSGRTPDPSRKVPRVLQVLPTLKTGGAEKTAVDIAGALADQGFDAYVASAGGRLAAEVEAKGAHHIKLPLDTKNPLSLWKNAARLQQVIKEHKINVIHARSRGPAWSALWAARRTGIAFVTTYHGAYNQTNRAKAFYNSVMARADAVIANSRWTGELVKQRYPKASDRIVAIPRGTDFTQFERSIISDERLARVRSQWGLPDQSSDSPQDGNLIVLLLGRLTRLKGHSFLIDAAAQTREDLPNLTFVFAGDAHGRDGHVQELKDKIAQQNLQHRVLMPGHCDDPAAAMALADIVVSASIQAETFGRTVVEASALEKPVIVTNIGAAVESILVPPDVPENERTGWKVAPASSDAIAEALREVARLDQDQRDAIGARGRAFVTQRFSLQQMSETTLEVYEKVLTS